MQTVSRREFLGRSAMRAAGAGCLAAAGLRMAADPLGLPVGFQVYPIRQQLAKDFAGTLKEMAGVGYRAVEMCSPPGYVSSGFGFLAQMKATEMRQIFHDAGLACESCHYQFGELREKLEERIAFAKELGLKQMILSTFGLQPDASMDDWRRAAGELNEIGARVQQVGLQLGFHNHNFEFREIDGVLVYDELMRRLDAKLVRMQFQVAVISLGYEAATYLAKYPGRFISLHLADWSTAEKRQVPVGKGVVDWAKLFAAAKQGGVKNYFVEMNMDAMKASYPFLHELKV
jgi:sugar phosphate isomerase/epimerase